MASNHKQSKGSAAARQQSNEAHDIKQAALAAKQKGAGNKQSASAGTRGGTPEQHAAAGRQSHKNDKK